MDDLDMTVTSVPYEINGPRWVVDVIIQTELGQECTHVFFDREHDAYEFVNMN